MLSHVLRALAALFLCTTVAGAQAALVAVGDAVTDASGTPLGTLGSIVSFAVTDASSWTVHGTLAGAPAGTEEVLLGPAGVFLREGEPVPQPNPGGATIEGFGPIARNAAGQLAFVVHGSAVGPQPAFEALFLGPRLLLRTGTLANLPTVPFGATYSDVVALRLARGTSSCAARLLVRVDVDTVLGPLEQFVEIRSGCGVVPQPTILSAFDGSLCLSPGCGSSAPGLTVLTDSPDGFATNSGGDVLLHVGTPLGGGVSLIGLNDVVDACDACSVCAATFEWDVVHEQVALADDGTRAVRGRRNDGTELIMVDGCTVARSVGDALFGLPGAIASLGRIHLAEDGVLFWYGTFPDAANGGGEAIFRDASPVVRRGVTTVGGSSVATIVDAPGSFASTGRSGLVAFRGTLADGTDGVFVVPTAPPVVPGSVTPVLGCTPGANGATLAQVGGSAQVGGFILLQFDGAQAAGAVPQLFFANQRYDPASACGLPWAGGEALLAVGGPNPVFGPTGVPWQPGAPPLLALGAPAEALNLVGETWYVQGLFYDLQGTANPNEPIRSTNALAVTFGSP